ncbi:MAG: type II toxin-antitoxin system Phd/YefM family antitoxin [Firmicutes bacterium]|nr:type II toxin-antitoxin system Phd/YefM family antitoxin [Bacillota bacterium]
MITATVATDLKENLKFYIEKAVSGDSIIITRPKKGNAVLISEEEYNELLRLKHNAEYEQKLLRSIVQGKEGRVIAKSIEELEAMVDE